MKSGTEQLLKIYCEKYTFISEMKSSIRQAFELLTDSYRNGNKLLVCGNGGSCSDADHITGELMKGFLKKRPLYDRELFQKFGDDGNYLLKNLQGGLPAVNLGAHTSLMTAVANDMDGTLVFAQQVNVLGKKGDVLLGISTSGNARDVLYAGMTARVRGMKLIGFTGQQGGRLAELADCAVKVPSVYTPDIQDMHTPVYHLLCAMVEHEFWDT